MYVFFQTVCQFFYCITKNDKNKLTLNESIWQLLSDEKPMDAQEIAQSTESLINFEKRLKLNQRRQASLYLGIDDKRAREVKMTTDDLISKAKKLYLHDVKKAQPVQLPRCGKDVDHDVCKNEELKDFNRSPRDNDVESKIDSFESNHLMVGLSPSASGRACYRGLQQISRPVTVGSLIKRSRNKQTSKRPLSEQSVRQKIAQSQLPSRAESDISSNPSSVTLLSNKRSRSSSSNSSSKSECRFIPRVCFR